tara:strand:- start:2087 stop:4507 length:2421 start_codon:yes stop_codon:yes gene_type:complete
MGWFKNTFLPFDSNAQSGVTAGVRSFAERQKTGEELDNLKRQQDQRFLDQQVGVPSFNKAAFDNWAVQTPNVGLTFKNQVIHDLYYPGRDNTLIDDGAGGLVRRDAVSTVPASVLDAERMRLINEIPGSPEAPMSLEEAQETFEEIDPPTSVAGLYYPGRDNMLVKEREPATEATKEETTIATILGTTLTTSSDDDKEALFYQDMPWKIILRNGVPIVSHNRQPYILERFESDDGGMVYLVKDLNGTTHGQLQTLVNKGIQRGIINTELGKAELEEIDIYELAKGNSYVSSALQEIDAENFKTATTNLTVSIAKSLGVDVGEALALLANESRFGNYTWTGKKAKGPLQIEEPAWKDVVEFYAKDGNKPAGMGDGEWNVLKQQAKSVSGSFGSLAQNEAKAITAALLYFRLIGFKGVPPELMGAAYNDGYPKFLKVKSLDEVKKFAEGHTLASVTKYNDSYNGLKRFLPDIYNNKATIGKYTSTPSGNRFLTVPNITESQNPNITNILDNLPELSVSDIQIDVDKSLEKEGDGKGKGKGEGEGEGGAETDISEIDSTKKAEVYISRLADFPDKNSWQFEHALEYRDVQAQFAENARLVGNTTEYKTRLAELMKIDTIMYTQLAYEGLNSFDDTGNPRRLNEVLNAFTAGRLFVQPRTDGKYDFIHADGTLAQGVPQGMSRNDVKMYTRAIFDKQFKASMEEALAKKNEAEFEHELAKELKNVEGNIEIIKQWLASKGKDIKTEGLPDGHFLITDKMTNETKYVQTSTEQYKSVTGETKNRVVVDNIIDIDLSSDGADELASWLGILQ